MRKAAIAILAFAMLATPMLAADVDEDAVAGGYSARSLLATNKADKADHGGWGDYGHGSGHWDIVPHGNHHHAVWHDTSHGGWGRKLMAADKAEEAQETDAAQHGGWGGYGGGHGHGSGHWDYVPHGNHHHAVWHDTSHSGWGRKLRGEDDE